MPEAGFELVAVDDDVVADDVSAELVAVVLEGARVDDVFGDEVVVEVLVNEDEGDGIAPERVGDDNPLAPMPPVAAKEGVCYHPTVSQIEMRERRDDVRRGELEDSERRFDIRRWIRRRLRED